MWAYSLITHKLRFLNFLNVQSWRTWVGGIAYRRQIGCITDTYLKKSKARLINISDNYELMKHWLIKNYGGSSRIVEDIVSNLMTKPKPKNGNRMEKFAFYSPITGAIQRLERLSRVSYIDRIELESCLLSRSTLSKLVDHLRYGTFKEDILNRPSSSKG